MVHWNFQLCWYGNKLPDKTIPLWEDGIQQWSGIFSNSFPRERLIFSGWDQDILVVLVQVVCGRMYQTFQDFPFRESTSWQGL